MLWLRPLCQGLEVLEPVQESYSIIYSIMMSESEIHRK